MIWVVVTHPGKGMQVLPSVLPGIVKKGFAGRPATANLAIEVLLQLVEVGGATYVVLLVGWLLIAGLQASTGGPIACLQQQSVQGCRGSGVDSGSGTDSLLSLLETKYAHCRRCRRLVLGSSPLRSVTPLSRNSLVT